MSVKQWTACELVDKTDRVRGIAKNAGDADQTQDRCGSEYVRRLHRTRLRRSCRLVVHRTCGISAVTAGAFCRVGI
jgi:hypothetical protein